MSDKLTLSMRTRLIFKAFGEEKVMLIICALASVFFSILAFFFFREFTLAPGQFSLEKIGTLFGCLGFSAGVCGLLYAIVTLWFETYVKVLTRKFGKNTSGSIMEKFIDEVKYSSDSRFGKRAKIRTETFYCFTYRYRFEGRSFEGSFVDDRREIYDGLEAGSVVPIRVLTVKPKVSQIRSTKLKRDLTAAGAS